MYTCMFMCAHERGHPHSPHIENITVDRPCIRSGPCRYYAKVSFESHRSPTVAFVTASHTYGCVCTCILLYVHVHVVDCINPGTISFT